MPEHSVTGERFFPGWNRIFQIENHRVSTR
jgi:hypothetical protein